MQKCNSLEEVRTEIDKLDTHLVDLISKRSHLIRQAASFKNSVDEVTLCDTWGKADQKTFNTQLFKILQNFNMNFSVHLHNINGKALENFEVAIEQGIRKFDTVFGATGGCPFSVEAGINLNIRDAMNVISEKGFSTNLNEPNFLKVENYLSKITGGENYEL